MAAKNNSKDIQITRIYDASVKDVWEAWVDPKKAAHWWGPRGFTITTHSKDLRPGGTWVYTMHGPDGTDYPNITTYFEVEKYAKLVYDHGASEGRPPLFRVTVLFSETKGKTKMDMTMSLATPEAAAETRKFIKKAGGNGTWDRLAEYLEKETKGKENFVINRSFEAPIETLFEMWTNPQHFAKWLPPVGFRMEYIRSQIAEGAKSFYMMTNGTDVKMYGRIEYLKIEKPNRLVYTNQFCDEKENLGRHPGLPVFPETMLTTVQFSSEGPEQTRVTITWEPQGRATAEEIKVFVDMRGSMTQGWTGSFDKLEELLEARNH